MDRSGEALRQYHVRTRVQCRSRNFEQQQDAVEAITSITKEIDRRGRRREIERER